MASELGYTPLGQLCDPERGITYGIVKVGDFVPGGVPVIRGGDIRNGLVVFDDEKRVTQEISQQFQRTILKGGEIVINLIAEPGHTAIVPPELAGANVSRDVGVIPLNDTVDHRYIDYCLKSAMAVRWLTSRLQGSVTQKINLGTLRDLPIPTPRLEEQRAIAHILGALDDKIELNRRMNEALEAMARALFKSWFVDFDPVRAKAEGRAPSLPQPLADLFPDRFVDSELGEIPDGWNVKTVGDLADIVGGSTPSTKEPAYWSEGMHQWATPKDLSTLTVPVLLDTERRITAAGLAQISSGLLPVGTVLLSSRAPIGYLAIAEVPVAINQGFIAMKPKKSVSNVFLLLWARFGHEEILSRANGSTFLEISKANFRPIPLVAPAATVMDAFDRQLRPFYDRMVECVRESRALAALRDTFLPKLVSGELRVKDAERFIGRAS
jgi:type I restriction enzyme, S subunit